MPRLHNKKNRKRNRQADKLNKKLKIDCYGIDSTSLKGKLSLGSLAQAYVEGAKDHESIRDKSPYDF